jgi:prevent-host-death family protein
MTVTTVSSRAFNQDTGYAKKATSLGPVIITDRGRPAHVLMTYAEYQRLRREDRNIIELLAMPKGDEIDFDIPKMNVTARAPDLS